MSNKNDCIQQRHSWEAASSSDTQEIPRILWGPNFHSHVNNSSPLQVNPVTSLHNSISWGSPRTITSIYVTVWWSISHLTAPFQMHRFIASNELRKRMQESSLDINGFDLYGNWPGGIATPVNLLSFSMAQQSLVGQGLLTVEASRSHSVGLLWTGVQPDAKTSTWQHITLTTETSVPSARFELAIPASEGPQTHALDRVATGNGRSSKRVATGYKSVTSVPYQHAVGVKAT